MGCRRHLAELRSAREQTVATAGKLRQVQIDFRPTPGRWSIGEVLDHLTLMEEFFRAVVTRLLDRVRAGEEPLVDITIAEFNPAPRPLPKAWLPALELPFRAASAVTPHSAKALFARYRMVRMQAPDVGWPRPGIARDELVERLVVALGETEAVYENDSGMPFERMIFRHPFSGRMDAVQLLEVLALHERRHHRQIDGIRASRAFPA